jgi:hypothetical protein
MKGIGRVIICTAFIARAQEHSMEYHTNSHHAHAHMEHESRGLYGPYSMTREASGTSWQPEATPMPGLHFMRHDWTFMVHGFADVVYDRQGGKRGTEDWFSVNMLMLMAQRKMGPGVFGVRTMLSLEPATVGREGYPELLQTGETANGRTELIDHQHPHDLFMELALTYSVPIRDDGGAFVYFGWPGEPALGPPTFMHRFSGMDNPEAPITHHWLDSTHISEGVATVGYVWRQFKLDGSVFTGREPDQHRWDIEEPRFDSYSMRLTWNPTKSWSAQVSYGWINSPEQLHPEVDTERVTASVSYHRAWKGNHWQTTLAWGQNRNDPGRNLDGFLIESLVSFHETHTLFARAERVEKDELFEDTHSLAGKKFTVHKLSAGYIYDFPAWHKLRFGIGAMGSIHFLPDRLQRTYGDTPLSGLLFVRAKL